MLLFLAAGAAGVYYHYRANVEFQRETDPSLAGRALLWKVLQAKVPPALAPGVLVQLGLHRTGVHLPSSKRSDMNDDGEAMCAAAALAIADGRRRLRPSAQVGKSQGVVDINTTRRRTRRALPNMTPAIAKALVAKRPFTSITDLNAFLLVPGADRRSRRWRSIAKAFVHINLNTATAEEILLVPGAGRRMTREFPEYRPWKTWAQFDREIGKYVGAGRDREARAVHLHPDEREHRRATPT